MMKDKLHWTTEISEKGLLAVIGGLTMIAAGLDIYQMVVVNMKIELADLFLLFIYELISILFVLIIISMVVSIIVLILVVILLL